jgi:uncharacterized membrane protein
MNQSIKLSIIKTVTWRILGSTSTFLIAWLVTGSWFTSTSIMILQMIANTILYYIHERLWAQEQ